MNRIRLKQLLELGIQEGPEEEQEVRDILKQDYETFVQRLGSNINDPKFRQAIRIAANDNPVKTKNITPAVTDLRPTQNEIDVDKSLKISLKSAASANNILKGGTISLGGPIITGGNGSFVIDGHHRWSQCYVLNPEIRISAIDISNISKPIEGLKVTQLGIAADIGKLPTETVRGVNLLTTGETQLKQYVIDNIDDQVLEVFSRYGKGGTREAVADYIWANVKLMQTNNTPVTGAPSRDVMPQTDQAPNWKDTAPAITVEHRRWKRIAGI